MAARQTEQGAEDATRKAADQATRSAREMSDAAERAVRTGAETSQRNSEQILSSWRNSADAANQFAEKWSKMFGVTGDSATQAMQQSFGNTQAVMETTTMLADGFRDLFGEWTRFLQQRAEQNLEHFERLMGARSPQEWMASQTEIARGQLEAFVQIARRTSERSTRLADEAARKLSETPLAPR